MKTRIFVSGSATLDFCSLIYSTYTTLSRTFYERCAGDTDGLGVVELGIKYLAGAGGNEIFERCHVDLVVFRDLFCWKGMLYCCRYK